MFNKIGLGGVLSFDSSQAESAMRRTGTAYSGLQRSVSAGSGGLSRSVGSANTAFLSMGAAMLPLAGAGNKALGIYTDFTKQMSAVDAVGKMTGEEFEMLRARALELGSTTSFTATEAAQGMEELRRAGFSVSETYAAVGGTLALAAADAMGLAEASEITGNLINGLGLSAEKDALRVADVLAATSAKSASAVTDLGVAFKYGMSTFSLLNMSLEESSAIMGKLSDAGLKGSAAGTSFTNMMNKLLKPTKSAAAFMSQHNIQLTDATGKTRKITDITQDLANALATVTDEGKRTQMAIELTGLRGVRALNGLMRALDPPNNINKLEEDLLNASGAAKQMADDRLNNLSGQFTLLESAAEGLIIRFGDMFKGLDGSGIKPLVQALGDMGAAWDELADPTKKVDDVTKKYGSTIVGIVLGIKDGFATAQRIFKSITRMMGALGAELEKSLGGDGVRKLTEIVTVFLSLAVAASPFITVLMGIAFVVNSVVIPAFSLLAGVVSAAFWPALAVLAAIAIAFFVLRNENESFMETVTRVWGAIKTAALDFYYNVLLPLWNGLKQGAMEIWPFVRDSALEAFAAIRMVINELAAVWGSSTSGMATDWKQVGRTISIVVGAITGTALRMLAGSLKIIGDMIARIRMIFVDLGSGNTLGAVKRLGMMLIDTLLLPLRAIAGVIAELMITALKIPGATKALGKERVANARDAAEGLQKFATQGSQAFFGPSVDSAGDSVGGVKGRAAAAEQASLDESAFRADQQSSSIADAVASGIAAEVSAGVSEGMSNAELDTTVHSSVCIDGKTVARNQARHKQDLQDRLGAQTPPFVRRISAEQGSV